jgi:extradiol dioxygenase family protein
VNSRFHYSFHVHDLAAARAFYVGVLGCEVGREAPTWVDIDFFGHELSLHLGAPLRSTPTGQVAGVAVPMPHFGAVVLEADWLALADRLARHEVDFIVPPQQRFAGQPGAQRTMFFTDPSGNAIEIKGFASLDRLFST